MSSLTPRAIQQAVMAWHNRQPLAVRIDESQVHSIGWVALSFLRPPQGVEPTMDDAQAAPPPAVDPAPPRRRWAWGSLGHRRPSASTPRPVFSEAFIDGLSARRAAQFAAQHGAAEVPRGGDDDWPQRRIDVDGDLAERSGGGWPVELWVISAAIDVGKERRRVLIAADGRAVAGPRHWRRQALQMVAGGCALAVIAAVVGWGWGRTQGGADGIPSAASTPTPVASAVAPAAKPSEPASAPPSLAPAASDLAGAPTPPAGAASAASAVAVAATPDSARAPIGPASAPDDPPPDIRPQLVKPLPNRRGPPPAPMLAGTGGGKPARASTAAPGASAPATPSGAPPDPKSGPSAEAGAYRGAATPEMIRPGLPSNGPLIALVSPGWKTRGEAEAMLARMTEHLKATMAQQGGLRGEVIESPEGWRAAVYPFATREEAAILNATMVARGWRTRSVSF